MKLKLFLFCIFIHFFLAIKAQPEYPFEISIQNSKLLTEIVLSKDEKLAAVFNKGGRDVEIYHILSGKKIKSFTNENDIKYLYFSYDNKKLFVGSDPASGKKSNSICVWNIPKSTCEKMFSGTDYFTVSPDGKYLIYEIEGTVNLWNIEAENKIYQLVINSKYSTTHKMEIAPDNSTYAIYSSDAKNKKEKKIEIYSLLQKKLLFELPKSYESADLGYIYGGNDFFVIDYKANVIEFWNLDKNEISKTLSVPKVSRGVKVAKTKRELYYKTSGGWGCYDLDRSKSNGLGFDVLFDFALFKDEKTIIKTGTPIEIWNKDSGRKIRSLGEEKSNSITPVYWNADNTSLYFATNKQANIFDISTMSLMSIPLDSKNSIGEEFIDKYSGNILRFTGNEYSIVNPGTKKILYKGSINRRGTDVVCFSDKGGFILNRHESPKMIGKYDIKTGKLLGKYETGFNSMFSNEKIYCSPNAEFFVTITENRISIIDSKKLTEIKHFFSKGEKSEVAISPDNKKIAIFDRGDLLSDSKLLIYNISDQTISATIQFNKRFFCNCIEFSRDGKLIAFSEDIDIHVFDIATQKEIKKMTGNTMGIRSLTFADNDNLLISTSYDSQINFNDLKSDLRFSLIPSSYGRPDWIIFSSEGYWDATAHGGDLVALVQGTDCWNIDQFAPKYNRPDLILSKFSVAKNETVEHFEKIYKKRLSRMRLNESGLSKDYHIPNVNHPELLVKDKSASIRALLSDDISPLKSYNIFVNDVPVFGAYGKGISGNSYELSDTIELAKGENKIEISCTNIKGAESYRVTFIEDYNLNEGHPDFKKNTRNLYYLGFGVSTYKNSALNLKYAHKDALDLEQIFLKMKGMGFQNVFTKTYVNNHVTSDSIKTAKEFLKNAKPEDIFILFIAGHGVHANDAEATYYFLTSDADPDNLKNTAADFETIEDLLQGIPPRNKLFLMDACESGEIDNDVQTKFITQAGSRGMKSRGFKVVKADLSKLNGKQSAFTTKRTYLYQKDRYIYNDLIRRSGAIVFSSSKGGELSYERSDIENGLFTEYIMKALTTQEADKDKNGVVSTDELREYVTTEVGKASGDLQHPTVDRDNIYQKFGFGIVK